MPFRLKSEDFRSEPKRSGPGSRNETAVAARLSDFSPDEWAIARIALEERRLSGGVASGESPLAAYCRKAAPSGSTKRIRSILADRSGASAIEFAIIAPLFLLMVCGMIVYGVWFSLAISVQSLATETARASLAGMDTDERRSLAQNYIDVHASEAGLPADDLTPTIDITDEHVRIVVRFDVQNHPIMAMRGLIPTPPSIIERTAVVGGTG